MTRPAQIRQADAKRLLAAARQSGYATATLVIDQNGGPMRLIASDASAPETETGTGNPWDEVFTDDQEIMATRRRNRIS